MSNFLTSRIFKVITVKMAEKCKSCQKSIGARNLKIKCNDCDSLFHAACVKLTKEDLEYFQSEESYWRCDGCTKEKRKSMRVDSELNKSSPNLSDVMEMLTVIREENKKQNKELEAELGKSVNMCHENIEDLKHTIEIQTEAINRYEKKVDELLGENAMLKKQIKVLEIGLDESEQYSRTNCIDINGVPDKENENVLDEVKKVGVALGINITDDMVDACHRLGKKREDGNPRGIVVKFTRRVVKEEILQKRRVKRNLNTTHIGEKNSPGEVIYINESLTKVRRELHKEVRALKKKKGFSFVWVRNGKILVRPTEGARVIAVTTMEDLEKLQNFPTMPGIPADASLTDENISVSDT